MSRHSRARERLKLAAMTWFVRLLRLIVVIADWWPERGRDQRGGSIGSVGPP
ncbi:MULTISPECIES: hypothetical protein, partial [Mycolicibacterium]|jgi:hypothetical protein|uniref:hypothetical protein n=1 Tax=Mycolicibacterium TaxID=1866885 RepID=UPI0004579644